jgi:hypothetical protein
MSASLFLTIPPELICQVFSFLNSFSSVAAPAQTGRIFYHTWRAHALPICHAIGPRAFSNYIEAERLLDVQDRALDLSDPQDGGEQTSIIRAKRLLFNARCAAVACADWVDFCQIQDTPGAFDRGPEGSPETYMQPSECSRVEHVFYSLWPIGVMQSVLHLQRDTSAFLDHCTAQELCRLDEMATWAYSYNDNEPGTTRLDLRDEVWMAGYEIVLKYWKVYLKDGATTTPGPDAHNTPLGFFAFFDHTQRCLEMYKDR